LTASGNSWGYSANMTNLRQYNYILKKAQSINSDIVELVLYPQHSDQYIHYQAGQYIIAKISHMVFPLSIANAPTQQQSHSLVFHLRYNTSQIQAQNFLQQLKKNKVLGLEGPYGLMTVENMKTKGYRLVLLAGGTGIAPFKALLEDLVSKASPLLNTIHLFWGVNKLEDLYLKNWLRSIKSIYPEFSYDFILSDIQSAPSWQGLTGWIYEHALNTLKDLGAKPTRIFASGPYEMIINSQKAFIAAGLQPEHFISDMLP